MDFRLYPQTHVYGGRMGLRFATVAALGRAYAALLADAPGELQLYLALGTGTTGKPASVVVCDCGERGLGEATRERFRRAVRPVYDRTASMTYLHMQHWDDSFPDGHYWYWKSIFLAEITEDLVGRCAAAVARQDLPDCNVDLKPMGGAIARVAPDATAFADRDAASTLLITTTWTDPREAEARIRWVRETWAALLSHSKPSGYINYMDRGDEERADAATVRISPC